MTLEGWLIEHSVELVSLIVSILGFVIAGTYLVKINKNQKAGIGNNSPGSAIYQIQGDYTSIGSFQKKAEEEIALSEKIIGQNKPKELLTKLENFLDENKKISIISEIALRLAKDLKMQEDEKWLIKEVNGFRKFLESEKGKGLKFKRAEKEFEHRRIEVELNLGLKDGKIEHLEIPMFISQSLRQIEEWVDRYASQDKIIMNAPPMQIMVETLDADPNTTVPYLVNPSSFKKILSEVRLKIIDFLGRVKEKID